MLYRIFLYGTKAVTVDAPIVKELNMLVRGAEQDAWKSKKKPRLFSFRLLWISTRNSASGIISSRIIFPPGHGSGFSCGETANLPVTP